MCTFQYPIFYLQPLGFFFSTILLFNQFAFLNYSCSVFAVQHNLCKVLPTNRQHLVFSIYRKIFSNIQMGLSIGLDSLGLCALHDYPILQI